MSFPLDPSLIARYKAAKTAQARRTPAPLDAPSDAQPAGSYPAVGPNQKSAGATETPEELLAQGVLIELEEVKNGLVTICRALHAAGALDDIPRSIAGGGTPGHRIAWPAPSAHQESGATT